MGIFLFLLTKLLEEEGAHENTENKSEWPRCDRQEHAGGKKT